MPHGAAEPAAVMRGHVPQIASWAAEDVDVMAAAKPKRSVFEHPNWVLCRTLSYRLICRHSSEVRFESGAVPQL